MASKRRKMRKPEQIVAKLQSADASHPGPHHGHDPSPDGIRQAVPDGLLVQPSQAGSFGYHQPPLWLGEVGGPSVGLLGPPRLVRVTAGQDPDSKSGKKSGADR